MSQLDIKALETNFAGWVATRAPDVPINEAFERYTIELIFCVLLDRAVRKYLAKRDDITKDEKADIRFYMGTGLVCRLANKLDPSTGEFASLSQSISAGVSNALMDQSCEIVRSVYKEKRGDDKAAKGPNMRDAVLKAIGANLNG